MSQSQPAPAPPVAARAPRVCIVAAVAANGVIGASGRLPWNLPEDLRHFKQLTFGHPVIMGRRTWDSLGRPLSGRRNLVVSRRAGFSPPGAEAVASLDEALERCAGAEAVFVMGGAELYREALARADTLYLTEIHRDFAGDTHFPDFDRNAWREAERTAHHAPDGTRFDFVRYLRA